MGAVIFSDNNEMAEIEWVKISTHDGKKHKAKPCP